MLHHPFRNVDDLLKSPDNDRSYASFAKADRHYLDAEVEDLSEPPEEAESDDLVQTQELLAAQHINA
ncbi:hypothetical protein N7535_005977 [Penicillium sp. DV-2018c]|nr:hypothetical protein N7461_009556 [Penicillium sp. DV-2018c]KAJ5572317.1 hypothetical protein N7535_005977 [Penicillium sp. DV-2018c]